MRFAPTTFAPTFGRVLSVIVAIVAVIGILGFVVTGDVVTVLRSSWGLVLMAAIAARTALHAAASALDADAFARAAPALYAAVLDDAAVLRALAEQFHDAQGVRG